MRCLAVFTLLLGSVLGCAGRSAGGENGVSPDDDMSGPIVDIVTFYRQVGRLAASDPLPFVGTIALAAASGDSVVAIVGLSLENRALAFQRDGSVFAARYRVSLAFRRAEGRPIDLSREEVVRVATFQETLRTDESVLFQQALRLAPGTYKVAVTVRDIGSTSESRAEQEVTASPFGPGTTTAPILTYQATGRGTAADPLSVVLNSRGAAAYGADTLLAYVEGYQFAGPTTVPFEVRDDQQRVIFHDSLHFRGDRPVESQVLRLAPDSLSLGEVKLVVGRGSAQRSASALVSFSQAWVVTDLDQVLDLLRYFGHDDQVDALRKAPAARRSQMWREFYRNTDPDPTTPENEALSQYFSRVASANKLFADEGAFGWQTDRGEVYINLGAPDEVAESVPNRTGRIVRWNYVTHRLVLFFQDETGFGRLRLTPGSRAEYERVLSRVRRQST